MQTAKTLSDWADAQADLSLRWAHMPFCWFCHEAAHMSKLRQKCRLARENILFLYNAKNILCSFKCLVARLGSCVQFVILNTMNTSCGYARAEAP